MPSRSILMIEHLMIDKIISLIDKTTYYIKFNNNIDPIYLDIIVDFIQAYADKTHHGKEEEILFKILDEKKLYDYDKKLMNELMEDHVSSRVMINELSEANRLYRNGDETALIIVDEILRVWRDFYPKHINKENELFFPASMKYLSEIEDRKLVDAFHEFDKNIIHEKYVSVIDVCEKQLSIT